MKTILRQVDKLDEPKEFGIREVATVAPGMDRVGEGLDLGGEGLLVGRHSEKAQLLRGPHASVAVDENVAAVRFLPDIDRL